MINPKEILKMANAATRRSEGYPERRLLHPHREWLIGLTLFSVLLIGGSVAASLLFLHYQSIDERIVTTEKRIPTYQAGAVSDVLQAYQARRDAFQAAQVAGQPADTPISTSSASTATTSLPLAPTGESTTAPTSR